MVFFVFLLILTSLYFCFIKIKTEKHKVILIEKRTEISQARKLKLIEKDTGISRPRIKYTKLPKVKLNPHYIESSEQLFQKFLDAYERPSKKRKD